MRTYVEKRSMNFFGRYSMAIHFVNFRDDTEYQNAIKVWSVPDFVHKVHIEDLYTENEYI